jgi:hypothetical protein
MSTSHQFRNHFSIAFLPPLIGQPLVGGLFRLTVAIPRLFRLILLHSETYRTHRQVYSLLKFRDLHGCQGMIDEASSHGTALIYTGDPQWGSA